MAKAPRAKFALPGGRFPLNTPGRIAAAPGLAAYSRRKGSLSASQEAVVNIKARAAKANNFDPLNSLGPQDQPTVASNIGGKPKKVPKAKKPMVGVLSSMNYKKPF